MKFDLIPHSSATTSWGLLEDVIAAIAEEPRRFDWGEWLDIEAELTRPKSLQPACGTMACIAGWTMLLTETDSAAVENRDAYSVEERAEQWFPRELRQDLDALFFANADYADNLSRAWDETQAEYAARGIAAIRKFMEKHETALKAHTIDIPKRGEVMDPNPQHYFAGLLSRVDRFEVIDETGRVLTRRSVYVELSYQDNDRTLKVFLSKREET